MKLLFLNLDGTVRQTISGNTHSCNPYDQKLIDGVLKAANDYYNWYFVGITNDDAVATSNKSLASALLGQRITLELFPQLNSIYICPDKNGISCFRVGRGKPINHLASDKYFSRFCYRKPEIGMIEAASFIEGISLHNALFVGNSEEDKFCAKRAGIQFIFGRQWLKWIVC